VNRSAPKIDSRFSLLRAYQLFRAQGLRHLVVVNRTNCVCGILTRKDLMSGNIEEVLLQKAADEVDTLAEELERGSRNGDDYGAPELLRSTSLQAPRIESIEEEGDGEGGGSKKSRNGVGATPPRISTIDVTFPPNVVPTPKHVDTAL
jgi:hypothetical protein